MNAETIENPAMMRNIPSQPSNGFKNSVRRARTGAAAACPVITSP